MSDLLSTVAPPDLREQIHEVERELAMRATAYPRFVAAGKLTQRKADYQIACLRAVLATLRDIG